MTVAMSLHLMIAGREEQRKKEAFTFYLGTHQPHWIARTDVPFFISARRLRDRKTHPKAMGPWCLDSGAFTELTLHGKWTVPPWDYVDEVRKWSKEIGNLRWAAVQDWPCEPLMREQTGKTVAEHQLLTTQSYITLRSLAPEIQWLPVLQGWEYRDYMAHLEQYKQMLPWSLTEFNPVGLGSVCRRQDTRMVEELVRELHGKGLKIHAFGFKLDGLRACARYLQSADSMAWSFAGREEKKFADCPHKNCANCFRWAIAWREKVLRAIDGSEAAEQGNLFVGDR